MAPIYISELLIPKPSCDRWTLRSDDQGLLHIPKIGTLSVHVGSLSEISQDTLKTQDPLSIVTMLNRCVCNFAGYAETKAIIFAMLCLMYAKGLF